MKTIYITGSQWQARILRDELDRAAGDAGSRAQNRGLTAGRDKVVDLTAWKAENLVEPDEPQADDLPMCAPEQYRDRKPVRRNHRRSAALDWVELAATLAVIAAFAALAVRVLLF